MSNNLNAAIVTVLNQPDIRQRPVD